MGEMIFMYGPPGSGKSTVGRLLAGELELPFWDLDSEIEAQRQATIPEIFAREGEAGFRKSEKQALAALLELQKGVVALGGGALLDPNSRAQVEAAGQVVCLYARAERLQERVSAAHGQRPLLSGSRAVADKHAANEMAERLAGLLERRLEHYESFDLRLDTGEISPEQAARQAQVLSGAFKVSGMGSGYDVRVIPGGLDHLGEALRRRALRGPAAVACDENVAGLYAARVSEKLENAGYPCRVVTIPAGEAYKTIQTVQELWQGFLSAGLERGSTVVALGGGVAGDLAGFAAATYLRGMRWVVAPTSLLAMVDSSLGGKTGADLPQGKNLVGAFHPPSLVYADPQVLATLPEVELRSGLAEVVKHGIIGDPGLFDLCAAGWSALSSRWDQVVRRAIAVKVRVIQSDPYEKDSRAALNLGHTIGHAVELASGFNLKHGEAVAIGMVAEARIAERMGLARRGLAETIAATLQGLGLPTEIPAGIDREAVNKAIGVDKKRAAGKVRFALPVRIGEVCWGVEVDDLPSLVKT